MWILLSAGRWSCRVQTRVSDPTARFDCERTATLVQRRRTTTQQRRTCCRVRAWVRARGQLRPETTSTQRHITSWPPSKDSRGVSGRRSTQRCSRNRGEDRSHDCSQRPRRGFKPGKEQLLCSRIWAKSACEVSLAIHPALACAAAVLRWGIPHARKSKRTHFLTCNPNMSPLVTQISHQEYWYLRSIFYHTNIRCVWELHCHGCWWMHAHTNNL